MRSHILAALCFTLMLPAVVEARPVSYAGGSTVMQKNNGHFYSLHLHYSPTAWYSTGYRGEFWRDEEFWLHSAAVNNLLKRWNNPNSQANLYLRWGLGVAVSDFGHFDDEVEPLGYSGLAIDWEDRRFFTSYAFRGIYAGEIDRSFHQRARVGVAPYIGEYGDIHTWIMLQAEHHPGSDTTFELTPLLRFFRGDLLFEAGISGDKEVLFNWVIRF